VKELSPQMQGMLRSSFEGQVEIEDGMARWKGQEWEEGKSEIRSPKSETNPNEESWKTVIEDSATRATEAKWSPALIKVIQELPESMAPVMATAQFEAKKKYLGKYFPGTKIIRTSNDTAAWSGQPQSARHEIGHHTHLELGLVTYSHVHPDIAVAMEHDLKVFTERMKKEKGKDWGALAKRSDAAEMEWLKEIAKLHGLEGYFSSSLADQKRISAFSDTLNGLSLGKLGGGHSAANMSRLNGGAMEAFAHAFSAVLAKDEVFLEHFPKLANVVRSLVKL